MVPSQIKNAYPMFWTATQDERSIVYFDALPSVGSDSQTENEQLGELPPDGDELEQLGEVPSSGDELEGVTTSTVYGVRDMKTGQLLGSFWHDRKKAMTHRGDQMHSTGDYSPTRWKIVEMDETELEQIEEMTTNNYSKWRDCSVPDDFQDVLLAEVELSKGAPEYFICIIDDNGMMVDPDTGDDFGWDYSCISRWVPFDEVLTWLNRGES